MDFQESAATLAMILQKWKALILRAKAQEIG